MMRNDNLGEKMNEVVSAWNELKDALVKTAKAITDALNEVYEPEEDDVLEENKYIIGFDLAQGESLSETIWIPIPPRKPPDGNNELRKHTEGGLER